LPKTPSSRRRSLIPPPHPVDPAPRSLPLLPTRLSALSRSPVTSRAGGGDRDTQAKGKAGAPASAPRFLPLISPGFLCLVPGYMSSSPTCARTLPPLITRPPSSHFSSVGLRAHPGPHSMYMGMSSGSGCRKGGGACHRSRILRAVAACKLIKALRAGFSGGADLEGRCRQIMSLPPSRPSSFPPKLTSPPGRCRIST
jgi:hypothetical protein